MAFCTKCGKELGPDGRCDCEKVQTQAVTETQNAGNATVAPEKSGESGKKGKTGIIAVAAVAVVVVLCVILFGGKGYKTPLKDLEKLINKQNTDVFAYTELMQSPMDSEALESIWKILKKSDDYADVLDELKDGIQDFYEDVEGLKISFDITDSEKLSDKDLKNLSKEFKNTYKSGYKDVIEQLEDMDKGDYEDLADMLDISTGDAKKLVKKMISYMESYENAEVSKGYEVELRCYGEMDEDEGKTERFTVTVLKVDGKWYIENGAQIFRNLSFDDDLSGVSLYNLSGFSNMNMNSFSLY